MYIHTYLLRYVYYRQVLGGFNIIGNNSHAQRAPDDLLSERLPTVEVPILRFGGVGSEGLRFAVLGLRFRGVGLGAWVQLLCGRPNLHPAPNKEALEFHPASKPGTDLFKPWSM